MLAGAAPPTSEKDNMNDVAAVVPAEAACLVEAGIPFPADPVGTQSLTVCDGTLFPTDPDGILFPADLAEATTVGVVGLADAGILFPAISEGILFPPDPVGTQSLTVCDGTLSQTDPAGILFPADLTEPTTVGVLVWPMLEYCFRPFLKGYCSRLTMLEYCFRPFLKRYCSRLTMLEYCFRPFLKGYCSRLTLLACCSRPTLPNQSP